MIYNIDHIYYMTSSIILNVNSFNYFETVDHG